MRDSLDLTPPQRTPVIRGTTAGRATPRGAEQSNAWMNFPFEDGAEQSISDLMFSPLEGGAEQSMSIYVLAPFE